MWIHGVGCETPVSGRTPRRRCSQVVSPTRSPVALRLPRPQRAAMNDRLSSPAAHPQLHGLAQGAVEDQRAAFELAQLADQHLGAGVARRARDGGAGQGARRLVVLERADDGAHAHRLGAPAGPAAQPARLAAVAVVVDRGQAVAAPVRVAQLAGRRRLGLVGRLAPAGQRHPVAVLERPGEAPLGVGEVELGDDAGVDRRLVGGQVGDQAAVGQRLRVLVDDEHAVADAGARDQRCVRGPSSSR